MHDGVKDLFKGCEVEKGRLPNEEWERPFQALDRSWAASVHEPEDQFATGVAEAVAQARGASAEAGSTCQDRMIAATLDANVVASEFVHPNNPPGQLLMEWRRRESEFVLSDALLAEIDGPFHKAYVRRTYSGEQIQENMRILRKSARIIPITGTVRGIAAHPEDDQVIATALSGGVNSPSGVTTSYWRCTTTATCTLKACGNSLACFPA